MKHKNRFRNPQLGTDSVRFNSKNKEAHLPLLLFPGKTKSEEAWLTQLRKEKKIHKIGPRLYTSAPVQQEASIVRSHWHMIIQKLFPRALLSHRSALEFKPTNEGLVFLTATTNRTVRYPGLVLQFIRGPQKQKDDPPFLGFHCSSLARAFLENLSTTKRTSACAVSRQELEERLQNIITSKGEFEIKKIRSEAKSIAKKLKWNAEFKRLDKIIGAMLGTQSEKNLVSAVGKAQALGRPYDSTRVGRFDLLFAALKAASFKEYKDEFQAQDHFLNKVFFESYFSNFIEGTTFEIEEAEQIVFDHKIPSQRPKDAHDILGTFKILRDPNEMRKTPRNFQEFEELLKTRHQLLMAERPEVAPGKYKSTPNRAGESQFVKPTEIIGTLENAFARYLYLPSGLAKAIYMMFLVTEVHPFNDGNGRIARIMMNCELYSQGLSTIIIPTVYREDYLLALRSLTRRDRPNPLIQMLHNAHQFSHMEFSPYSAALQIIKNKNWFREPDSARLIQ